MADNTYTEDDTFRILRRLSYDEMLNILQQLSNSDWDSIAVTIEKQELFLNRYGWTVIDFCRVRDERRG